MSASLYITNSVEFNKILQACADASSRTFPQFINGQGLRMASFAVQETQRADASAIAAKLGQTSTRIRSLRNGAMLKHPRRVFSSRASLDLYRIINWRRERTGRKPLGGKAMSVPARKMRAAALRSTAFIAAGWIYAVRGLARAVGYAESKPTGPKLGTKISGKEKGWVNPAKFALNAQVACEIGNTSLIAMSEARTGSRPGNPLPIAWRGLVRARDLTARDMLEHLAQKLRPILNQYSAT